MREVVEEVAFQARADRKIDKRSGVSQRLPITTLELVVSNAERRALANGETLVVPRVTDLYAALPSITGKFELEYEGELRGAEQVARDLIRSAVGSVFTGMFDGVDTRTVDRVVRPRRLAAARATRTSADEVIAQTRGVQGLRELAERRRPAPRRAGAGSSRRRSTSCSKGCTRRRRSAAATSAATRRRRSARRAAGRAAKSRPIDEELPDSGREEEVLQLD